jgi:hypothetical protein
MVHINSVSLGWDFMRYVPQAVYDYFKSSLEPCDYSNIEFYSIHSYKVRIGEGRISIFGLYDTGFEKFCMFKFI